jgi:hypothetical protein
MQDTCKVKFGKIFSLPHCFEHSHRYKEPTDPKESIDCEICGRYKRYDSRRGKNIQAFRPVFDVIEAKPLIMTEDNPEDGKHSRSI